MSDKRQVGAVIDGLGVESSIEEGDLVEAVVVIMKVVEPNGDVRMSIAWSDGLSWIERLGMVTAAQSIEATPPMQAEDDD